MRELNSGREEPDLFSQHTTPPFYSQQIANSTRVRPLTYHCATMEWTACTGWLQFRTQVKLQGTAMANRARSTIHLPFCSVRKHAVTVTAHYFRCLASGRIGSVLHTQEKAARPYSTRGMDELSMYAMDGIISFHDHRIPKH